MSLLVFSFTACGGEKNLQRNSEENTEIRAQESAEKDEVDFSQAVLSFLNEYDLSGKTVIPFCTHDGYGAGHSCQTIADASHGAVFLDGIAIEAKDVQDAQDMA